MNDYSAGYTILSIRDSARERPILVDLWYPVDKSVDEVPFDYKPGFGRVAKDAEPEDRLDPIVLLSHGAFGAARNYTWITEYLARNGYVVAGVSHFGESFIYGPETIDPGSALRPWLRTQDCSYALDFLLGDTRFVKIADSSHVGAIGHSSGGATILEMAGAELDLPGMERYCASEESKSDKGCMYARQVSGDLITTPLKSLTDNRIRAIVAMDPALGPGHTEASLKAMHVAAYIIGAVENDFLPYTHHAGRYARMIPGALHTGLTGGEGHFIFLNEGKSDAGVNGVPLYKDRTGVSRAEVHNTLQELILEFFEKNLRSL